MVLSMPSHFIITARRLRRWTITSNRMLWHCKHTDVEMWLFTSEPICMVAIAFGRLAVLFVKSAYDANSGKWRKGNGKPGDYFGTV